MSNESGIDEIYVRPFSPSPAGESVSGGKWMVSKGGGAGPIWRADGKELYYLNFAQFDQMAVDVTSEKTFQAGVPRRLFGAPQIVSLPTASADGKRFLFPAIGGSNTTTPFTVVLNWEAALKK